MEPIIETVDLSCVYSIGTPFEHKALDRVNFTAYPGEYIGIIGHTGSGKSTLIQHLNGLLKPTSGQVRLRGQDIWADKKKITQVRFHVGLVFQYPEYQLFEETVYKDISFGPRNMGLSEEEIDQRVRQSAQFVGLTEEQLELSPFELSGGQKRRVAIAGVIAMEPKCVVLDEPTAMLDPIGRQEVLETILKLNREQGTTVVLITHHMDEAALADRLIVMNDGNVIADGAPKIVFQQVDELKRVGLTVPDTIALLYRLRKAGVDVPLDALSVEECAAAIQKAIWPHTTVR